MGCSEGKATAAMSRRWSVGMSFAVIENVAFDPADVRFFRADGVVLAADRVADTSTSSVQA